jgi:hypothetical protein
VIRLLILTNCDCEKNESRTEGCLFLSDDSLEDLFGQNLMLYVKPVGNASRTISTNEVVEPIQILMPRKSKRKPGMYRFARLEIVVLIMTSVR